jgi:hypothetical protein
LLRWRCARLFLVFVLLVVYGVKSMERIKALRNLVVRRTVVDSHGRPSTQIDVQIFGRDGCSGKVRYSAKSAQRAVLEMERKKPGEIFEAYTCPVCDGWHIGHAL